jgi:uncharacterized membrane protein
MSFLKRFKDKIRGYFFAGILVILPLGITLYLITVVLKLMDRVVDVIPAPFNPETYLPVRVPGFGLVLGFILVVLTGMLVKNYIGRRVVDFGEYLLSTIPLVRPIYSAMKQITQAMFGETQSAFKRAVLVEFPREGLYSLAFVTGVAAEEIEDKKAAKLISVFVPTTPNPTSGFYLMVPPEKAIPLDMSVEDAFKLLISVGIAAPGNDRVRGPFGKRLANGHRTKPVRPRGQGACGEDGPSSGGPGDPSSATQPPPRFDGRSGSG